MRFLPKTPTTMVAVAVAAALATPGSAEVLLVDFGRTDLQSGRGWNNVVPATTVLNVLFDQNGAVFGSAGLEITDPFFQAGEPSSLGSEQPSGAAAGFPVTATDDYFYGHSTPFAGADPNPLGQVTLFGLDPDLVYDFTFFASRQTVGDTRDALYTVRGASSAAVALDASNNDTDVAIVLGMAPDTNGEIVIDVEAGPMNDNLNGFFYFGLMRVETHPAVAPTNVILLDFGRTDLQSGPGWNNIVPATDVLLPLVEPNGVAFGSAGLEITDPFFQTGEPSSLGSEQPGGAAAEFPVSATDDYFYGHTTSFAGQGPNPLGQFTLFDLDPSLAYSFTFFASRQTVSDTREAVYTVQGMSASSVVLDASNNDSQVAVTGAVLPNGDGEIVVDVEPGPMNDNLNGFYYLGLVKVNIFPAPEPVSGTLVPAILLMTILAGRRRRREGALLGD